MRTPNYANTSSKDISVTRQVVCFSIQHFAKQILINPFKPNEFSHYHQLGQSIFVFKG